MSSEAVLDLVPLHKFMIAGVLMTRSDIGVPRTSAELASNDALDARLRTAFGPFDSIRSARLSLQRAESHAFGIKLGTQHPGAFRRSCAHGARRVLVCTEAGCPYKVTYELTCDKGVFGWCMFSCATVHSPHVVM